jgi:hypothetical protein
MKIHGVYHMTFKNKLSTYEIAMCRNALIQMKIHGVYHMTIKKQ